MISYTRKPLRSVREGGRCVKKKGKRLIGGNQKKGGGTSKVFGKTSVRH